MKTRIALILFGCSTVFAASVPVAPVAGITLPPEYRLVWSDEFSGNLVDRERWNLLSQSSGGRGDYDPDLVTVSNGILRIALAAGTESVRSGRISTQGRFSASEGYFEVCARLPEMHGVRAVFRIMSPSMGLFFNDTGRGGTEIHVFQSLGLSEAPDRSLFQGIYWNPYVGTRIPTNEEGHILSPAPDAVVTNDQKQVVVMAPPRTLGGAVSPAIFARKEQFPWGKDFHRYGVWWSREGYRFFVDGRVTHEISEAWSGVPEFLETWLDLPLKSRVHTGVRAELELDYVRVYAPTSAVAGASVPVAAVPSSPVPPGPEKKP